MSTPSKITRSVSLYSFQEEFFHRRMTLEQILAVCAELGIPGVEILGDQMIRGYPNIPDAFVKQWHGWMDQYGLEPACLDNFLDYNKFKGRVMSVDEQVESMTLDILNAKKLGIPVIRVIHDVQPIILERLAPAAEKHQVKLALEVHAPSDMDSPFEQELYELFRRLQSPYVGFAVDFSLYTRRLPRIIVERYKREGMHPQLVEYLETAYNTGTLPSSNELGHRNEMLPAKVMELGGREIDIMWAFMGTHMICSNPRKLLEYMPYILHVHGKFWEMLPDYTEYSIPNDEVIPVLMEGGYNGYLSSEYEGNRWLHDALPVDSKEQVRRHQVMLKNILKEA